MLAKTLKGRIDALTSASCCEEADSTLTQWTIDRHRSGATLHEMSPDTVGSPRNHP